MTAALTVQVIPTVGVEGEDGEKKRLAMLKHFSRLLDPLAKKAKFLSAFQKKPSSTPQDELPATASVSLKAAPSGAHAAEGAVHVKEEAGAQTGSGGLHDSTEGPVKQEKDLSLADIKAEGIKVEAEVAEEKPMQKGAARAEVVEDIELPGKGKDPESEADISTSDSDVKPEELQAVKEELADCLQDSDKAGENCSIVHLLRGGAKYVGGAGRHLLRSCHLITVGVCLCATPTLGCAFCGALLKSVTVASCVRPLQLQTRNQSGLIWRRLCSS